MCTADARAKEATTNTAAGKKKLAISKKVETLKVNKAQQAAAAALSAQKKNAGLDWPAIDAAAGDISRRAKVCDDQQRPSHCDGISNLFCPLIRAIEELCDRTTS